MKGKITISRRGSFDDDNMNISIKDNLSGTGFLSVTVGLGDFTKALSGQAFIPCDFEVHNFQKLGTKREHKTVSLDAPRGFINQEQEDAAVAPYEVDGWEARRPDLHNSHNWTGEGQTSVCFERWVNIEA